MSVSAAGLPDAGGLRAFDLAASGPRVVPCEEQGPVEIALQELFDSSGQLRLNPEIENGDYFALSMKRGKLTLRARGYVGYIPLNDRVVVHVRPRVPISNLSRMARIAGQPPTVLTSLRQYEIGDEWNHSLADLYATALIRHVEEISQAGLLRDYQRREGASSFPHGRVLLHRTLQDFRARGIRHAAHIVWHERSPDNACNRCLKYAIWLLAQQYIRRPESDRSSRRLHRRLNAIFALFDGVELDHRRRFLDDPVVRGAQPLPTLRAYYRDALNVALAIIEQRAVLIESTGAVRLPSLVLNMNEVFEAYVRETLSLYAIENNWGVRVVNGKLDGRKLLFEEAPSPDATPDVVLLRPDGTTPLILEVKNVPVESFSGRDGINQAVTYAVSYRTKLVVLVHPRGGASQPAGLQKMGDINDIAVYQYRMDLDASDLVAEDRRLGESVATLLPPDVM